MRVLIVESDCEIGLGLRNGLKDFGYAVDLAQDGPSCMRLLGEAHYGLVVMNTTITDLPGWHVLARLCPHKGTRILLITDSGKITGPIGGGALTPDDSIAQPFSFVELLTRVRVLLKRGPKSDEPVLQIADLEIDLNKRKVTRAGVDIPLTRKEFVLLQLLVQHQGEPVSRAQIVSHVWSANLGSEGNLVDVTIKRLRAKIDRPFPTPLIHSVWGIGYRCQVST